MAEAASQVKGGHDNSNNKPGFTLEEVFHRYRGKIYGLALMICRNENDAEEVLSNTLLKIIKNIDRFRGESSLATWIYRIAYNEALMYLRRRRREISFDMDQERISALVVNWPSLSQGQAIDAETKERVEEGLRRLALKYRIVLLLHSVEDLPLKVTASILRLKVNTVKSRLHRAYAMLHASLRRVKNNDSDIMPAHNASCEGVKRFIYAYADQDLNRSRHDPFYAHLRGCSECKDFFRSYQRAISITKALECKDIPPRLIGKIEEFLSQNKK